jgi:hypothetical protein
MSVTGQQVPIYDDYYAFSYVLERCRNSRSSGVVKAIRSGWNGKGFWITAQFPDEHSKMTHPYFYIEYPAGHLAYPNGSRVPWFPSQTDLWAQDWMIL